jgi:hypothetical protein
VLAAMMAHSSQSREPHHGQPGVFASFGRVPPCGGDGLAKCPRNAFRIGTEQAARSGPRPDGIGEIRGVAGGPATPSTPNVTCHRNFKQPDETRLHILGTRDRARVIHQACPSEIGGRREGRVAGRTHGPPAIKKAGGRYHRFSQSTGLPCAMVLRLMARSPRGPGFLAPVTREIIISRA